MTPRNARHVGKGSLPLSSSGLLLSPFFPFPPNDAHFTPCTLRVNEKRTVSSHSLRFVASGREGSVTVRDLMMRAI